MIVLHATFPVEPDRREEALDLVETLVEQSNEEEGMLEYRAAIDVEDENTIRFFEQYDDEEALAAHNQTDHFQAFEERLSELLAGEPEVVKFEVSDTTDVDL
ncbi:putative quinol monooxygenase [Halobacterium wangiae]|uniref:putative quinol monooxygenase n=1 Tax=Halobacterium wangiae TaxID=2902623 RepID=UPI001E49B2A7|nr:putative quinol monooxygenase [Halobacterium wangiae]